MTRKRSDYFPASPRLNQLGCSIMQLQTGAVVANDPTTAPAFIFIAGIMGGLFAEELETRRTPRHDLPSTSMPELASPRAGGRQAA